MLIRYEQLTSHLEKSLAPIYLVFGNVPLLMEEACAAIRDTLKKQGCADRQVFHVESGFSWENFSSSNNNLSLFAEQQLVELRFADQAIKDPANHILQAYAEKPAKRKILLITVNKLDATQQKAAWFQAIQKIGVIVQLWPISLEQLPLWIKHRLAKFNLSTDAKGTQLLIERTEGNLLALAQEIEKLHLVFTDFIPAEEIAQIFDHASYDVYQLADAALSGNSKRALHILEHLHHDGTEATLILWALAREIRTLANIIFSAQSLPLEQALQKCQVWEKRKPLFRTAAKHHSLKKIHALLQYANSIDATIKGATKGNVWRELERLTLFIAGVRLHATK